MAGIITVYRLAIVGLIFVSFAKAEFFLQSELQQPDQEGQEGVRLPRRSFR